VRGCGYSGGDVLLPRLAVARFIPPLSTLHPKSAGEHAEYRVLQALAQGLGEGYTVFHSVKWALVQADHDRFGELDVVVVNRAGDVAILEVKAGMVSLSQEGVFKRYGAEEKDLGRQAGYQFHNALHAMREAGLHTRLHHFLVLPDQTLSQGAGSAAYPRERIADATDFQDLAGFVQRRLGSGQASPVQAQVCDFFANRLQVEPDVSALAGQLDHQVARLADGLATWVPRISSPSGVIRVQGTAGCGKTQLALRLMREAKAAGRRAAYQCFNRSLADHIQQISPIGAEVFTFHQTCWEHAGRPAGQPDFSELVDNYTAHMAQAEPDLDMLIIDELQDFHLPWVQALTQRLKPQAKLYLFEDPSQCLYPDREEIDIPDAVTVTCHENFRSPQKLVQLINLLRLTPQPIEARSPWEGQPPGLHSFRQEGGSLVRSTRAAVQNCLDAGFELKDIVVLSWRGLNSSRLMNEPHLGEWRTQRFDGSYDTHGRPNSTQGELRMETLRRFKGQSAPALVLTEVDFTELGEMERRLLFTGITRAKMHLEVVLSEQAEGVLMGAVAH
jgi:hypothetical protein